MKIQINTSSYNHRRYSRPWIAKVNFSTDPKGDFIWGAFIGRDGEAGILVIEANDGDIVARGQKDYRNSRYTECAYYQVRDGKMVMLPTKADAYRAAMAR